MTVVVALLVQRSIQNPEVRGSNPVIGKLYIERFTVNCIEKTKIQKRGQLFKKTNHNIGLKRKTEQDILKKNFWAGKARTKKIEMMEKVKKFRFRDSILTGPFGQNKNWILKKWLIYFGEKIEVLKNCGLKFCFISCWIAITITKFLLYSMTDYNNRASRQQILVTINARFYVGHILGPTTFFRPHYLHTW